VKAEKYLITLENLVVRNQKAQLQLALLNNQTPGWTTSEIPTASDSPLHQGSTRLKDPELIPTQSSPTKTGKVIATQSSLTNLRWDRDTEKAPVKTPVPVIEVKAVNPELSVNDF
jgi:hypothetical protein